jgi:hypothetical protein
VVLCPHIVFSHGFDLANDLSSWFELAHCIAPCIEEAPYLYKEDASLIFICWRLLRKLAYKVLVHLYFSKCCSRIFFKG